MKQKGVIFLFGGLGVLTLIVLVALFFFYPKEGSSPKSVATSGTGASSVATGTVTPNSFDPVEWTRSPQPGISGTPTAPVVSGTTTGPAPSTDGFVVTMNPPTSAPSGPAVTFPPPASNPTATTSPSASYPQTAPETSVSKAVKPQTEVHAAKKIIQRSAVRHYVLVHQYWIQVGAYKDRFQAQQSVKALRAQGLKGELFTFENKGQTIVRVRVGPYADKKEAEKFLAWVKPVKGMEGSFVTRVTTKKLS